jgi:hypothetical protein
LAWTSPRTWVSSEVVTAALLNTHVRDNELFLRALHGCRCTKSGTQSPANSTDVALLWDQEDFDTDALHSTVSNTSRIVIPSGLDGYWRINASVGWAASTTGSRVTWLRKNGTTALSAGQTAAGAGSNVCPVDAIVNLVATDYVEVMVQQNSGGALATANAPSIGSGVATFVEAVYLGS